MFCKRDKSLTLARIQTPNRAAPSVVSKPNACTLINTAFASRIIASRTFSESGTVNSCRLQKTVTKIYFTLMSKAIQNIAQIQRPHCAVWLARFYSVIIRTSCTPRHKTYRSLRSSVRSVHLTINHNAKRVTVKCKCHLGTQPRKILRESDREREREKKTSSSGTTFEMTCTGTSPSNSLPHKWKLHIKITHSTVSNSHNVVTYT